ncbi:hypothetical protein JTF06_04535 [Desemzia sp. RIT804]|uniref:hypothetical protein n=1 Tax=Desemzia sp. RIT 804 TaxID=2810209 RepID=UPI001952798C|nr:hypothetical protein [Desemzia sp. RIT 804]MBM6613991.1 hypothetical protein [Desemzia sp. RIT 804]MBM6614074.1 hypothetical protein [Desemzia sp. RIT 804]MBM6614157.1 hypothetical protein [Desemzia sp. RIT 804]
MEFNNKVVRVEIFREEEQVSLIFNELRELKINLSDSSVEDIKNLFNSIFDTIVDEKELISLELKDEKNDLFHEVAEDIIDQLNSEIEQSKSDLIKIIDLNFKTN